MKVLAIIPSLVEVDKDYLELCVDSLRDTVDWSIVVVTNGGRTTQPLDRSWSTGRCTHLHTSQQGQCNAVNIGAQHASPDTDYLFVINADMYFAPGWNKNLKFKYPVFSPNLVEPVNNAGSAPPFLKFDGGVNLEEFKQDEVDKFIQDNKEKEHTTGFNLPFFIKKEVWDTIGGYDVKYDPWGSNSDTDLQTKINLAGITPMRLRDVLVYHFSNKSGTFDGTHQEDWQRNWDYFDQKWGFNRDMLESDVWMNTNMLPENYDLLKYHPDWEMKYADD